MSKQTAHEIDAAYDSVVAVVRERLSRNLRIRRNLPGDGRLRIDRQLPFLCVYRTSTADADPGTCELVTTEASYLFASGEIMHVAGIDRLVGTISTSMREHFGAFLILEIWAEADPATPTAARGVTCPRFRIVTQQRDALADTLKVLEAGLRDIRLQGRAADVEYAEDPSSAGRSPLTVAQGEQDIHSVGLAVRPVYRDVRTGTVYPVVLRSLRRQLAVALRKGVFAFTGQFPDESLAHYEALGPSSMVKSARLVDQEIGDVSQSFDFVLQTVPLNVAAAWEEFQADRYTREPAFYYRPLPYDPAQLKRRLFAIPIDRIEDATLIQLFAEKQDHVDRQLSALMNIGSRAFYYDSIQLYGVPDGELSTLARSILSRIDESSELPCPNHDLVAVEELVVAAREEIDYYHQRLPGFVVKIEVRNDLASSMMIAHDRLFVSANASLTRRSVEPLLHHEIGTHLLTYFNGKQQPFQQLYAGLAHYEELQEGLAVLAEFLSGGLTPSRLRTIACRVLAVQSMVDGRSFIDTFHSLHDDYRLPTRTAFMTTLRVYRGGGLTKDAIYLRGLRDLVQYLAAGHDAEPLYVGKIALAHVSLVQELRRRGIVGPPVLLPRFWDDAVAARRLDQCRRASVLELVELIL